MAPSGRFGDALSGRAIGVGASILLHLALLLPIGLAAPRLKRLPAPPPAVVVPVTLFPVDLSPTAAEARLAPRRSARPPLEELTASNGPELKPARERVEAGVPVGAADEAPAGTAEDRSGDHWAIAAGRRLVRPCPEQPGEFALRPCPGLGRGSAAAQQDASSASDAYARIEPSRAARSDRAREEGFDRQARANEAWRAYTRGEGPYPGLRSLFSER